MRSKSRWVARTLFGSVLAVIAAAGCAEDRDLTRASGDSGGARSADAGTGSTRDGTASASADSGELPPADSRPPAADGELPRADLAALQPDAARPAQPDVGVLQPDLQAAPPDAGPPSSDTSGCTAWAFSRYSYYNVCERTCSSGKQRVQCYRAGTIAGCTCTSYSGGPSHTCQGTWSYNCSVLTSCCGW